ncbi:MAG: CheB methylesterase [Solirubrobacterales bacterium]|nr:CheB methylesterase [Solirubrobacterales bacterium]
MTVALRGRPSPPTAVFVGASAGGVEALSDLLSHLTGELRAPVLIVLHLAPRGKDLLASILDRAGPLAVRTAEHGQTLQAGVAYVGARRRHMVVDDGRIALTDGPPEHGARPAIDPLFRSGARSYGPGAIGVVLSGMLSDGTSGLGAIRAAGGHTLAQDPTQAAYPPMPANAINEVDVEWVLSGAPLAAKIEELASGPARRGRDDHRPPRRRSEAKDRDRMPTTLTCPRCGSPLWERSGGERATYECDAGHGFSAPALAHLRGEGVDDAIWQPVRRLHQRGTLQKRLSEHARAQGRDNSARYFAEQARVTLGEAQVLRDAVRATATEPHRDPHDIKDSR